MNIDARINQVQKGLKLELGEDIKERIIAHRNQFFKMFQYRYFEFLPLLVRYVNHKRGEGDYNDKISIDFVKLEVALSNNWDIIVGETTKGNIMVLGYTRSQLTISDPKNIFRNQYILTKDNLVPVISDELIPDNLQEITMIDNAQTGNFVVFRNKVLNYVSDYEIIEYYAEELAEVVTSRFSLIIQSKLMTVFRGEINDEGLNQIIKDLYNGAPFIKTSLNFDVEDNVLKIENPALSANMTELKREYQNKLSELNNMLGITALGVEKESGVTESESKGNMGFTTSNASIKLVSRQTALTLLNKRYNLGFEVVYNDRIAEQLINFGESETE